MMPDARNVNRALVRTLNDLGVSAEAAREAIENFWAGFRLHRTAWDRIVPMGLKMMEDYEW